MKEARAVQNRLTCIWPAMSFGSFPAPVKAAMELLGLLAGASSQPIVPLDAENQVLLRREV